MAPLGYGPELLIRSHQPISAISLNDSNVKLDRFEAFGLRKIREQVNMCMGFSLTSGISAT